MVGAETPVLLGGGGSEVKPGRSWLVSVHMAAFGWMYWQIVDPDGHSFI